MLNKCKNDLLYGNIFALEFASLCSLSELIITSKNQIECSSNIALGLLSQFVDSGSNVEVGGAGKSSLSASIAVCCTALHCQLTILSAAVQ